MSIIMKLLVLLIALEHLFILWVEMFRWETLGKKMFQSIDAQLFPKTKVMAANQGLYNGFLVVGLIWSVMISSATWSFYIAVFFLLCVIVAGIFGAFTSSKSIFFKQALPAILVLSILCFTTVI